MTKLSVKILILSALILTGCGKQMSVGPILKTQVAQGEIEGELHEGYALYKAIPYAEAPVGELRWQKPVPKRPWQGVYKADEWGARPFQKVDPNQNGAGLPMSEDCLYLSVQTPATSKKDRLPVFVMIHGGAFQTGSYSGTQESFVKEGIVYVNIEYRLGALGFMVSQSGEGNFGIYDQICALQWVHDNIAAFGGDPERVTICGESAGGISVGILCASPLSKGLFQSAISESGSNFCPPQGGSLGAYAKPLAESQTYTTAFLEELGAADMEAMRAIPADTLIAHTRAEEFWPVVDGKAIVDDPWLLYEQGRYNAVNLLIGYNSDEGSLFLYHMPLSGYEEVLRRTFGDWADRAKDFYPATNDQEALYAVQDIFRDNVFGWPTYIWAEKQAHAGKNPVFMYYFAQKSQNSILKDGRGATHVAEMPFIYGWNWGPMTEEDNEMAAVMTRYWINFIKTGNPNGEGLPEWDSYHSGDPCVMEMQHGFRMTDVPNRAQMDFWTEWFEQVRNR